MESDTILQRALAFLIIAQIGMMKTTSFGLEMLCHSPPSERYITYTRALETSMCYGSRVGIQRLASPRFGILSKQSVGEVCIVVDAKFEQVEMDVAAEIVSTNYVPNSGCVGACKAVTHWASKGQVNIHVARTYRIRAECVFLF